VLSGFCHYTSCNQSYNGAALFLITKSEMKMLTSTEVMTMVKRVAEMKAPHAGLERSRELEENVARHSSQPPCLPIGN
jgi:hypothetical protein